MVVSVFRTISVINGAQTVSGIGHISQQQPEILTDIIPTIELNPKVKNFVYANEADMLNLALFGKTASDWRKESSELKGNIRDYATLEQLVVFSNLKSFNAELIEQGISANNRFQKLNNVAVNQMKILIENKSIDKLKQLK